MPRYSARMIVVFFTPPTPTNITPMIEATIEIAPSRSGNVTAPGIDAEEQISEQHRGDGRDAIGFEEVGGHAGAIADVVADVVGDDGWIARIVFGNAGFDLTDEVGADVGGLRVDAAAQTREDRDQRTAEGQADHRIQRG